MIARILLLVLSFVFALTGCWSPPQIGLEGLVKDLGGSAGLHGVNVCLVGSSSETCTDTDDDGIYTLSDAPGDSDISLTVTKEGYIGGTIPLTTPGDSHEVPVVSMGGAILIELQMGILNVDAVENTGQVAFSISNGINGDNLNIAGITVNLAPNTADGPFYSNASGLPEPELEETSANGGGLFVNVVPGQYSLSQSNLPENCLPMLGWGAPDNPGFEVIADRVTYVRIECPVESSP